MLAIGVYNGAARNHSYNHSSYLRLFSSWQKKTGQNQEIGELIITVFTVLIGHFLNKLWLFPNFLGEILCVASRRRGNQHDMLLQIGISDDEILSDFFRFKIGISDGKSFPFRFRRNQFSIGISDFFPFRFRTLPLVDTWIKSGSIKKEEYKTVVTDCYFNLCAWLREYLNCFCRVQALSDGVLLERVEQLCSSEIALARMVNLVPSSHRPPIHHYEDSTFQLGNPLLKLQSATPISSTKTAPSAKSKN